MAIEKNGYIKYVEGMSPPSPVFKNTALAFLVGGMICTVGQGISELWKMAGAEEVPVLTSASLILIGALLTGFKLYDNLAKYGGAGTLVPITGFANAIVSCALEYKSDE